MFPRHYFFQKLYFSYEKSVNCPLQVDCNHGITQLQQHMFSLLH